MKKSLTLIFCVLVLRSVSFAQAWDTLPNIPEGLAFPVVVVLNGDIHVIGDGNYHGATDHHYRYDPATNNWDTLPPVPYYAQQPAGAVVNGKIHYFGGGYPNSGTPLDEHFVYDPANQSWTAAANLPIPRVIMKAAVINGKIFALSGQPDKTRVDVYDPATNAWTSRNPLPDNNFWYSALVVNNNEMYRFGGGGYTAPVNKVHKYDSVSDSWTSIATLPVALHAPAGCALGNKIYISGGYNGGHTDVTSRFDPDTAAFSTFTPLPGARSYHEMVTVDSCIYCLGGDNPVFPDMNVSFIRLCNPGSIGMHEIAGRNLPLAYPNPASAYFSLNLESEQVFNLELFDITGAKRMTAALARGANRVDISALPQGIYFYRLFNNESDKPLSGKIIKL